MRKGLVVEQSTTPMNGSMEGLAEEIENCQPEVPQSVVSCRPRLTRVPSDRRKRTGPEPSWGGKRRARIHMKEDKKETMPTGGVRPGYAERKEENVRGSGVLKKN
jgi:hypothetical protein